MTEDVNHNALEERYLCFTLGKEPYAIPLLDVREVIAPSDITPVPQSPKYFLGILNLRGQIISVVDLRLKLGMQTQSSSEEAIIICDLGDTMIGVWVDSIDMVYTLESNDSNKEGQEESQNALKNDFVKKVFKANEKLVLALDIKKALSGAESVIQKSKKIA